MRLPVLFIVPLLAVMACIACAKEQSVEMRALPGSPTYQKQVQDKLDLMEKEEQVVEQADWFGKTGLPEAVERELPRYLRREFGQSIFEKGSLRADNLQYVGVYPEGLNSIRFWRIVDGAKEPHFAYISVSASGKTSLGWGGKQPPVMK